MVFYIYILWAVLIFNTNLWQLLLFFFNIFISILLFWCYFNLTIQLLFIFIIYKHLYVLLVYLWLILCKRMIKELLPIYSFVHIFADHIWEERFEVLRNLYAKIWQIYLTISKLVEKLFFLLCIIFLFLSDEWLFTYKHFE